MKTNRLGETNEANVAAKASFANLCLASCRKLLAQIGSVKSGVVAEFRGRLHEHEHLLELAVNEAEAVAWESGFPQLFFPTLAVEKARAVATWHERQQFLRRHRSPLGIGA